MKVSAIVAQPPENHSRSHPRGTPTTSRVKIEFASHDELHYRAYRIAASDGNVDASEVDYMYKLGASMKMSQAHIKDVLAG